MFSLGLTTVLIIFLSVICTRWLLPRGMIRVLAEADASRRGGGVTSSAARAQGAGRFPSNRVNTMVPNAVCGTRFVRCILVTSYKCRAGRAYPPQYLLG